MRLAIFDAVAAQAIGTLDAARAPDRILAGSDAFWPVSRRADQFDEPQGWWARVTARGDEHALDLKKLGTFPIVHGVRALCLKHHVRETGTAERLRRLGALNQIDAELGRDLLEALHYLMGLKLRHQLRQRAAGRQRTWSTFR
jgi:CBS domain-containing protein